MLFLWQDLRPLYAGRCQYYSKSTTPPEVRAGSAVSCEGTSFLVQVEEPAARQLLQYPRSLQSEAGVGGWVWGGNRMLAGLRSEEYSMYCLISEGTDGEKGMKDRKIHQFL